MKIKIPEDLIRETNATSIYKNESELVIVTEANKQELEKTRAIYLATREQIKALSQEIRSGGDKEHKLQPRLDNLANLRTRN